MPYRKPVPILTPGQRERLRDRFQQEEWKADAATSFGFDSLLHAQPLPKGWKWSGLVYFDAASNVVEGTIVKDSREVGIVCTADEARTPTKLWPVIHTCIHGPEYKIAGKRKYPRLPKLPLN